MTVRSENADSVSYAALLSDATLLLILFISFTAAFSAGGVSAALPSIGTALGVSEGEVGLVMTAFFLPLIFAVPITGVLADLFGRRNVVLPALLLVGLTGVGTLFVETFSQLLVLRGLQGVAYAGTLPMTATLIGDRYSGEEGSVAQGLRASTHGLAFSVGPVIAGVLAAISWEYAFLLFSLAFPTFALAYLFYAEPVTETVGSEASMRQVYAEFAAYWTAIRAEATDSVFVLLFSGGFVLFVVKRGIWTFIPGYAVSSVGVTVATGGLILSVYGVVQIVVPPTVGPLVSRFGRRVGLAIGFGFLFAGPALVPFAVNAPQLGGAVGVVAVGDSLINPLVTDSVSNFASEEYRGGVIGGLTMFKVVASAFSPAALGVVIALAGYESMFLLLSGVAVVFVTVLLFAPAAGKLRA